MDYEMMTVRAGDLVPGTYWLADPKSYFPRIGWRAYEDTFRMLMDSPEATGPQLPLYHLWGEWCAQRFGPTWEARGGLAWSNVEARARELLAGFEAHGGFDPSRDCAAETPIRVIIQGDGSVCVVQGNKRVALIRLLHGLDYELEVGIHERDGHWRRIREILRTLGGGREELYQPLPHPDFRHWAITQPCTERLAMIRQRLGPQWSGRVLDLGCHTGWLAREFTDGDHTAVGVELSRQILEVAEAMGTFRHDRAPTPRYVCAHAGDWLASTDERFDACLCLSLIMHTFRKDGAASAWRQLAKISELSPMMFLDCVWGGYAKHLPFGLDTIGEQIVSHTTYTSFEQLGWTEHEHRPFLAFWR